MVYGRKREAWDGRGGGQKQKQMNNENIFNMNAFNFNYFKCINRYIGIKYTLEIKYKQIMLRVLQTYM